MAEIPREDGEAPIQMQSEVAGAGEASFSSNTDSTKQFLDFSCVPARPASAAPQAVQRTSQDHSWAATQ